MAERASLRRGRARTAAITNLGCKVNQAEMDAAERLLRGSGVRLVDAHERADVYLVNTCTVTAVADQKSRQAVRRARRANPDAAVLVTGCSVQTGPAAFQAADPEARLLDNRAKDRLLDELAALLDLPPGAELPTLSGVEREGDGESAAAIDEAGEPEMWPTLAPGRPIPGIADERTAIDRTRAYVKVQDGCSFHCTYCVIPRARGPERSLPPDVVLADVRRALAAGHREIVLTGINVGTYDGGASERGPRGSHRWAALTLAGLVRRILAETEVERIRLSSIEPQHVDDELLATWTGPGAGRCLPHVHLPLQSGDDGVLRRMGRRYTAEDYADVVRRIRAALPDAAVHADVIVGFPTEDEAALARTADLVRRLDLAGLHVFRYSGRPGTPAVRMAGQVPEPERKARAATLLAVAAECKARFAARSIGRQRRVLFEERVADGRWVGHAEDHVLVAVAPRPGQARGTPDLGGAIGVVLAERVDPGRADRQLGTLLELVEPRARPRRLPLLDDRPAVAGVPSAPSRAGAPSGGVRAPAAGADHAA